MRILLTGGSGFVGMRLVKRYQEEHDFAVPTHSEMDITSEASCLKYMKEVKPELVIHLAAISNMATCEKNPEDSYQVNLLGAMNVANASKSVGAKMIFASSDQVYNGSELSRPGKETDELIPKNVYANHKLEAEKYAIETAGAVCLRLPWMCDAIREEYPAHADFFSNLNRGLEKKIAMKFLVSERRSITNVNNVIENIIKMAELPSGAYNFAATGYYNVYEIASGVVKKMEETTGESLQEYITANPKSTKLFGENITMDMEKVTSFGIEFDDVIEGIGKLI